MSDRVLDLLDDTLADFDVSHDAMRWAPGHVPDLRPTIIRTAPADSQARWRWWCPTCARPIPQPRWHTLPSVGRMLPYHHTVDTQLHRVRKRRAQDE